MAEARVAAARASLMRGLFRRNVLPLSVAGATIPALRAGERAFCWGGIVVGVRLSGGVGPLRVSVPLGGTATGFAGLVVAVFKGLFYLVWFELWLGAWALYGCYWLLRAVYWEAPRAGWRWWQRRQARVAAGG